MVVVPPESPTNMRSSSIRRRWPLSWHRQTHDLEEKIGGKQPLCIFVGAYQGVVVHCRARRGGGGRDRAFESERASGTPGPACTAACGNWKALPASSNRHSTALKLARVLSLHSCGSCAPLGVAVEGSKAHSLFVLFLVRKARKHTHELFESWTRSWDAVPVSRILPPWVRARPRENGALSVRRGSVSEYGGLHGPSELGFQAAEGLRCPSSAICVAWCVCAVGR